MVTISEKERNSLIQLLSINAIQHKLENMDLTLQIEKQIPVIKEQPEGRCFKVGAELPKFQSDFIDKLYADEIKSPLFQEFSSDEEKLQFAKHPEEWNRLADVSDFDFSGAYQGKCGSYIMEYSGYILKKMDVKMTESSQDAVIMGGLLLQKLKGFFASANNDLAAYINRIYRSVDQYMPEILEMKEKGLTSSLYSYVVKQFADSFLAYPVLTLKGKLSALKEGVYDTGTVNKVLAAAEKLKTLPDLDDSLKSEIEGSIEGIKNVYEKDSGSSKSGCLSVIVVLLMIIPAISFGIAKLLA